MSGVLEDYPLDFSRPELRAMRDIFARTIYQGRDVEEVVLGAGLNPGMIDFGGNAAMQWRSILVEARAEERLPNWPRRPLTWRRQLRSGC